MTPPLIAIVGRPNVGKSTLYNRLVGGRPALVHDTPGLTRDRRYGEFEYFGHDFRVVDTGGLDPAAEKDVIGAGIHRQAHTAIEQSDAVLFVVDATAGVTALDREIATMLRKVGRVGNVDRPLLVCANKVDHLKREALVPELYELGMGEIYPISAAHGRGVDELLDALIERLELPPPQPEAEAEADAGRGRGRGADRTDQPEDREERPGGVERDTSQPLRVAFVGKPNAGKSSLLNRLVGVERALVHHEPGTTTDPVDTSFEFGGRSYVLVDTAGIRRKARIDAATEKIAVSLALDQIRRADVVVLVIDGHDGPSEQDARLAGSIEQSGRAVVIALNKADLLGGPGAGRKLIEETRDQFHFLPYAPMVLISALRGDGVADLMATIDEVAAQFYRRVSTAELNRFFAEVCETHPPPIHRGRSVRINYITQGGVAPPTFILWASTPKGLSPSYQRFIKNQLRARYGFAGTPLRLFIKAKVRRPSRRRR
jgi:GTP-binding protein